MSSCPAPSEADYCSSNKKLRVQAFCEQFVEIVRFMGHIFSKSKISQTQHSPQAISVNSMVPLFEIIY